MAFTVETGEGVEGANAYVPVDFVDDYHTDRSNGGWSGTTEEKQAAIIRASDYVDKRFSERYRGYRQTKKQGMQWPRLNAMDDSGYLLQEVPAQLQKAVSEYALRALSLTPLAPDPAVSYTTRDTTGTGTSQSDVAQELTSKRTKIGPIDTKLEYKSSSSSDYGSYKIPPFPEADMLLSELLISKAIGYVQRG